MLASTSPQRSIVDRLAALSLPGEVHIGRTRGEPIRRLPSDVRPIDALLDGGLPRGRLSEVLGPRSSGKTSFILGVLTAATRRGEVAACVDVAAALHPASVARAGTRLRQVLWVRPPSVTDGVRCAELLLRAGGFGVVVLDFGEQPLRTLHAPVWPRLQRAAGQSHTALVVVAPHHVAGSCAALSLGLQRRATRWQPGAWPLFDGYEICLAIERNKLGAPGGKSVIRAHPALSYDFRTKETVGDSSYEHNSPFDKLSADYVRNPTIPRPSFRQFFKPE